MITEKRSKRIEKFAGIDIYPVISSEFTCGRDPLDILKAVADGGAKIVQMREKHRTAKEAFAMAEKYREICSNYDMLLIIDDYADYKPSLLTLNMSRSQRLSYPRLILPLALPNDNYPVH